MVEDREKTGENQEGTHGGGEQRTESEVEWDGLTSGFRKYPPTRNRWLWDKSSEPWLKDKQSTDAAEGLWRVHDDLYDLEAFAAHHPGGRFWIETTRGHDITELFEASHSLNTGIPERLLEKYHVRKAASPRNAPYTFHEHGFYRTLKRRAAPILRKIGTGPTFQTKLISDTCFCVFVGSSIATAIVQSKLLAAVSAFALSLTIGTGHNFFHQRDNMRMFYLDLSFLSSAEWRVSHAMSHHIYPNTAFDLEITSLEPFVRYLTEQKPWLNRGLVQVILSQLTLPAAFFIEALKRVMRWCRGDQKPRMENFLPFLHLLLMGGARFVTSQFDHITINSASNPGAFFGLFSLSPIVSESLEDSLRLVLPLWGLTHVLASYIFLSIGFAAAHHHPEIFHDGDVTLTSSDWGLQQLNAVGDRIAIRGNLPLVLTTFGDHGLHHLFPTVDHAKLKYLYPVFEQACEEYGVRYRYFSAWELVHGGYQQMSRSEPRESNLMKVSSREAG